MKFLVCLAFLVTAAQAGVVAPVTSYSAFAPASTAYTATAPAYTTYATAPTYTTSSYTAPALATYSATVPSYAAYTAASALANSVYSVAPVAYTAPVTTYSTFFKK